MKVTVCIGSNKLAIPYSHKNKVRDILESAIAKYHKHASKVMERSGKACHLRTLDGAILDNDDFLCDVIDDNDVIRIAIGDDDDGDEGSEGMESLISSEFPENTPPTNRPPSKMPHIDIPPLPANTNFHQKFSTGPRLKSTKTPDGFKSREDIFCSFSRLGARKSLGNSLAQESWYDARSRLQANQALEDALNNNCRNNSLEAQNSCLQDESEKGEATFDPDVRAQTEATILPAMNSSSLVSINQLTGEGGGGGGGGRVAATSSSLPPHPSASKIKGQRPASVVIGYLTEFRGRDVTTKKLESTPEMGGANSEGNSPASSSSSSMKKKKNQSNAVLAPSNTRVIGKMLNVTLTKGSSGLGFTITSRDNMAELNSPIYIKNILPGGAAQMDGRLKLLDRLLSVNGVDISNARQDEATQLLRQIPIGRQVELLISRQVDENDEENDEAMETSERNIPREGAASHQGIDFGETNVIDACDANSSRQPSMTKEMEKFLCSSKSPPYQPPENIPQLVPRNAIIATNKLEVLDTFGSTPSSSSKSVPTTPSTLKWKHFPSKANGAADEGEEGEDHSTMTFNRKGFGRQSMSEKRKGHIDPRTFDFYRQMTSQKLKGENAGDTSYATWDSRKAARMRKAEAASVVRNVTASPSMTGGEKKQYKSLEELSANQEQSFVPEEFFEEVGSNPDKNKEDCPIVPKAEDGDGVNGPQPALPPGVDVNGDPSRHISGRSNKKMPRICKEKKMKSNVTQEHKKLISYMKKTVENFRLSPKLDASFGTPLASPRADQSGSATSGHPLSVNLDEADAMTFKDVSARTISPSIDDKSNPGSSFKFAFRSLPKRLSKVIPKTEVKDGCGHQWTSPGREEEGEEVVPQARLQPEGKEERLMAHGAEATSPSDRRHRTLAQVPVLRVEEASNIYKDISFQQQLYHQHRRANQNSPHSSPHLRVACPHYPSRQINVCRDLQNYNQSDSYFCMQSPQRHNDIHQQQQQQQQSHLMHGYRDQPHFYSHLRQKPREIQNFDNLHSFPVSHDDSVGMHRPQRSYDGSCWAHPMETMHTSVSLKMRPYQDQNYQTIPRESLAFSQPDNFGVYAYSPEVQHRAYHGRRGNERYVTTLKVNCDDDDGGGTQVGSSIVSPVGNSFGYHLVQPSSAHYHQDASWTRSARV